MKIIDISLAIHPGMRVYKGRDNKQPIHTQVARLPEDSVNESQLTINLHTGTHMDSPLHMKQDSWATDALPLNDLITPAKVLDLTAVKDAVTREDLAGFDIHKGDFLLLKTRNSFEDLKEDFVYLRQDAAFYLASKGIKGLGMDALGVERDQPGHLTHHALMDAGILIIEGLDLSGAPAREYLLIALPLKIRDAEGAPARAILVEGLPANTLLG